MVWWAEDSAPDFTVFGVGHAIPWEGPKMRKFSKLLVAVFALGAITVSTGCKSDCEKLYDHSVSLLEKAGDKKAVEEAKKDGEKKKFVETTCKEFSEDEVKCMLGKNDQKEMFGCVKPKKK